MLGRVKYMPTMTVVDCTQYTVTLRDQYGTLHDDGLGRVEILERNDGYDTLALEIRD